MRDGGRNGFLCDCGHGFTNSFMRWGRSSEHTTVEENFWKGVEGQPILQHCDLRLL